MERNVPFDLRLQIHINSPHFPSFLRNLKRKRETWLDSSANSGFERKFYKATERNESVNVENKAHQRLMKNCLQFSKKKKKWKKETMFYKICFV